MILLADLAGLADLTVGLPASDLLPGLLAGLLAATFVFILAIGFPSVGWCWFCHALGAHGDPAH